VTQRLRHSASEGRIGVLSKFKKSDADKTIEIDAEISGIDTELHLLWHPL
jgi:hypothetical protein